MAKVNAIRNDSEVEDLLTYLKATNERNFIMALTSLYSGLRIGDVLKLKVRDVQGKKYFDIREDKTNNEFKREIPPKLIKVYKEYCKDKNKNEYLIKSREGYNKPISETQAWRIINKAASYVKIRTNIGCHSLRKTFAWNVYILSGRDIEVVRRALNHSSASITKRYLNINDMDVERAINKLNFRY